MPSSLSRLYVNFDASQIPTYLIFLALAVFVIASVVFINEAERKIPVSYSKQVRGNRVYGGASTYLPLKVNQAGVIPIIFAISILLFPQFFGQMVAIFNSDLSITIQEWVTRVFGNNLIYGLLYFILVFIFTYFYTAITFEPNEIAKNLQRFGGFIPGMRPGQPSADFLKAVVYRTTLFGALFLGIIAVLPNIVQGFTGGQQLTIGGTALLIVVAVAIDTIRQIDSQLTMHEYEGIE